MIALLQRVRSARVEVEDRTVGSIGRGLLAFVCAEPTDTDVVVERMVDKILKLRIFADDAGKMNRSVVDAAGGLLIVSQFTLAADTSSGMRPGFSTAAIPGEAEPLFARLVHTCAGLHVGRVETGRFGAHMAVSLTNDGPVTFLLKA